MKNKMKRAIEIEFEDGTTKELNIAKVVAMHGDNANTSGKIYIEKFGKNDDYRLMYTEDLIDDFSKVKGFNIIREG